MRDYYDISDILSEEERVPLVFDTDARGIGYLVEGSQGEDVEKDAKVELPYWLAEHLALKKCVSFETPHYYNLKFRNSIIADTKHADLRNFCQVYYQLGMRMAPWLAYGSERDQRELDNDLVQIMTERFHNILDHSQNSQNDDNTDFTNRLSATELQLYWEGYASAGDYLRWKHSKTQKINHSWLVELHDRRGAKRRRLG
eukprot:g4288.t1